MFIYAVFVRAGNYYVKIIFELFDLNRIVSNKTKIEKSLCENFLFITHDFIII